MRKKKWLSVVALAGALALVTAACAGDEVTPPAPTDGTESPTEDPRAACDADAFGCVEYAAGEPIKIGTLLVISGADAPLGQDSQNGVVLGLDRLDGTFDGANGQILGHDVELVNEDDGCSAEGGQAGATKLAADPTIAAVIGTSCSSAALGVADRILSERGVPLISPSNTNPNLTAEGTHQDFYLRTAHNDKTQGAVVATFLYDEMGARTMATINDESPYADALAAVARAVFENKGGEITAVEALNSADTDVKPVLQRIAEGKPDVLYFPDFQQICGLVAKQSKEVAGLEDTILIGSDGCGGTTFADVAGEDANGMFISGPDLTGFTQAEFYTGEFLPAYEDAFGSSPTALFHAHAFDAFNITAAAIEQVGIELEDGGLLIPRTALKDALLATSEFEGITGTVTCNELGDCSAPVPIAVYEIPNDPFVGGDAQAQPAFSLELSVIEADELIGSG